MEFQIELYHHLFCQSILNHILVFYHLNSFLIWNQEYQRSILILVVLNCHLILKMALKLLDNRLLNLKQQILLILRKLLIFFLKAYNYLCMFQLKFAQIIYLHSNLKLFSKDEDALTIIFQYLILDNHFIFKHLRLML